MPYRRRFSAKMPDFDDDVTVVDVYDLASDIGKECEIIIEKYGPDAVTALLPKVINALELLENLAIRNEKENQALQELTAKIAQLENDKIEKAEYRQRFEKEIEAIEEQWRTESAELVTAVSRLQDENKRLRRTLNAPSDGSSAPPSPAREHDQEVLSRLTTTAEKQRATLRHQEQQLQDKQQRIEGLSSQVEKFAQVARDIKRKHKALQNQMRVVCEERSELTAIVQSQQRDIAALQQAEAKSKKCSACGAVSGGAADDGKSGFSGADLKDILQERDELRNKLGRAEEQLQALQAGPRPDHDSSECSPVGGAADDEPAVQGPLPAEPDDAPWKRQSGIRKFFRKFFAESDFAMGTFSRNSLSSLAKMSAAGGAPPPPRRHSDPTHAPDTLTHTNKTRRYSEIKNPKSKLDLRQELQNLNLNTQDFVGWLGNEFEEKDEFEFDHEQFKHDIPLQRSISLDRGIDVFNYLQTLGSDWSGSDMGSSWTVDSDERESLVFEQYRSFEDIPASQSKMKSRRVSDMDAFGRNLALSVLRDSYKGVDTGGGSFTPQIKKLQRSFTFPDRLEDFIDAVKNSTENLNEAGRESRGQSPTSSRASEISRSGLDRMKILHRSLSFRNSADYFNVPKYESTDDDNDELEVRTPIYRSISMESRRVDKETEPTKNMRQRRVGVTELSPQGSKKDVNLRREVLTKRSMLDFKSCDNISSVKRARSRRSSAERADLGTAALINDSYFNRTGNTDNIIEVRTLNRTISAANFQRDVPTIVITDHSISGVASDQNVPVNSSKVENVEISRCDCRICTDYGREDRSWLSRRMLGKLLLKIVSCREYGRKLTYWDENNNMNDSEMYKCVINVLKLMLGLWLRHLDHNTE